MARSNYPGTYFALALALSFLFTGNIALSQSDGSVPEPGTVSGEARPMETGAAAEPQQIPSRATSSAPADTSPATAPSATPKPSAVPLPDEALMSPTQPVISPTPTTQSVEPAENSEEEGQSGSNNLILAVSAIALVLGGGGAAAVYKLRSRSSKEKERENNGRCSVEKAQLDAKRAELGLAEGEFSIKKALLELLEKKLESMKAEMESKAKGVAVSKIQNIAMRTDDPKKIKRRTHELEDLIVDSIRTSGRPGISMQPDKSRTNWYNVPNTGITAYYGSETDLYGLMAFLGQPTIKAMTDEIDELKDMMARAEAVKLAEKIKGSYEEISAKIAELKEVLDALRGKGDGLKKELEGLQSSYNSCMLGMPVISEAQKAVKRASSAMTFLMTKPKHVLIFGPLGSGKSHISDRLRRCDINAVEDDGVDGLKKEFGGWNPDVLKKLLSDTDRLYFFTASEDAMEYIDLFDKKYFLKVPEEVISRRLQNIDPRRAAEAARLEEKALRRGAVPVDATRTLEEIFADLDSD